MKLTVLPVLLFAFSQAAAQEDYTLRINDTSIKVSLDRDYELLVNGKKLKLSLKANEIRTYEDDMISFQYPNAFNVSKTKVADGIEQLMIVAAEGSGVIIQKYATLNPSMLNEMMLREVTKESIGYGYESKRQDYKRVLASGQQAGINKAVLTYKDETNIYEIATIGKKDEGVVIMTMKMNNRPDSEGQKLIDLVWKTIKIK